MSINNIILHSCTKKCLPLWMDKIIILSSVLLSYINTVVRVNNITECNEKQIFQC